MVLFDVTILPVQGLRESEQMRIDIGKRIAYRLPSTRSQSNVLPAENLHRLFWNPHATSARTTLRELDCHQETSRPACAETRAIYDDHMQTTGATSPPLWIRSLGHSPALAKACWERAKGTLFGGSLPLPLKEMVVFVVSARNGANYCSACHAQCVLHLDQPLAFADLERFPASDSVLGFRCTAALSCLSPRRSWPTPTHLRTPTSSC
jgi:Carboxymuconolactone decarboxylase family